MLRGPPPEIMSNNGDGATFFTVLAVALALYYVVSGRSRNFEEQMQQLGEITEEELKQYDESDSTKLCSWQSRVKSMMCQSRVDSDDRLHIRLDPNDNFEVEGIQILGVCDSVLMLYGSGGLYAMLVGKDVSRALAKLSVEEEYLTGDISDLGEFELGVLQDWEYKFMRSYVKIGTVKKTIPVTSA
ncbi:unnamed protein product [Ilex paraguariensis]|uniref:Cytochrome b5 heme-binding domain-containing protein n=1 Tax=Ilex paraguariensis TaxID=185542 RepID=A0ABC8TJ58_9AQUA